MKDCLLRPANRATAFLAIITFIFTGVCQYVLHPEVYSSLYKAERLKEAKAAGTTYYIDPSSGVDCVAQYNPSTFACDSSDMQTMYNSWADVAWTSGNSYLQKRGTTFSGSISVGSSGVTIGAYGSGEKPIIDAGGNVRCMIINTRTDVVVDNIDFRAGTQENIFVMGGANNITFSNIHSENPSEESILLNGVHDITIEDSSFVHSSNRAILDANVNPVTNVTFTRNTITATGAPSGFSIYGNGIYSGFTVSGNNLNGCGGIYVTKGAPQITNNTAVDLVYTAITAGNANDFVISGNVLSRSLPTVNMYGIDLNNSSGTIQDNDVSGSFLRGISFQGTSTVTSLGGNNVHDLGIAGTESHGYWADASTDITLNNDTAHHCHGDGFAISQGAIMTCNKCLSYQNGDPAILASGDGFTAHATSTIRVRSSVAYGNYKSGIAVVASSSGEVINSTFFNNYDSNQYGNWGVSIQATGTWSVKNNILSSNETELYFSATALAGGDFITSDYNDLYTNRRIDPYDYNDVDSVFSDYQINSGKDAHSKEADPLFVDASTKNFHLSYLSPAIDAGTSTGMSTDFEGNPIYGTPDIGAYEYQPPFTMGVDQPDISGDIRIYADGKFRNRATISGEAADFSIEPFDGYSSGNRAEYMDIEIIDWSMTGDKNKEWRASSSYATGTAYTIGSLLPDKYYSIMVDDLSTSTISGAGCSASGLCQADSTGKIEFEYSGGYSSHLFSVIKETTPPDSFDMISPSDGFSSSDRRLTFSWGASSDADSGLNRYILYIDGVSVYQGNENSVAYSSELTCGSHTWQVGAVDNNDNETRSASGSFRVVCQSTSITFLQSLNQNKEIKIVEPQNSDKIAIKIIDSAPELSQVKINDQEKENIFINIKNALVRIISDIKDIGSDVKEKLNIFVAVGRDEASTKLGQGERAGLVDSFKTVFGRMPSSDADWQNVSLIAQGQAPKEKNAAAEEKARSEFKKLFAQEAAPKVANDRQILDYIAYGLRPQARDLEKEKNALKQFTATYKKLPKTAWEWNIVRAVAYSGK